MSNYPVGQRPRSADPHSTLRLAALTAVVAGVVLLAAAAFVLSYSGIHSVALQAGVSPDLAKLYPVIFDAMLVVAGAAAMALRGAGWWSRFYAWACLIALLVAVAIGDAVHATGTALPERALRIAVAITPWVLLLLAFGLLLTMLRHFRKSRAAVAARQEARAAADAGIGVRPTEANGTAAGRAPVTWATAGAAAIAAGPAAGVTGTAAGPAGTATATEARPMPPPRFGLDFWLGPRHDQAPTVDAPYGADGADTEEDASHGDPVSYGEETGYVHPDSYRDEGEYSPHGDSGGPGMDSGSAHLGQDAPAGHTGNGGHSPLPDTPAGTSGDDRPADATTQVDIEEQSDGGEQADGGASADDAQPTAEADDGASVAEGVDSKPAAQADDAKPAAEGVDSKPAAQADGAKPAAEGVDSKPAAEADDAKPAAQADGTGQAAKAGDTAQAGEAGKASTAADAADGGPAGEGAQDEASGEPVADQGPALERVRSTPTRPED
jgi:Protein of unknown function (DUF2637)